MNEPLLNPDAVRIEVAKWAIECGHRVEVRRKELNNMDRRLLAEMAGTTEATIHRIESGKLHPRDPLKLRIADALAVDVDALWPWPTRQRIREVAA